MEKAKLNKLRMKMNLQYFAGKANGVYPCYENQFQIATSGSGEVAVMSDIADCHSFSVSFDNTVQEWTTMSEEGWRRALMTGKAITISVTAKRNVGDKGNDKVSSMTFSNGRNAEADFQWTFPDGTIVKFPRAVVNVTNNSGGESTDVAPLEFEVMSNGKPEITLPSVS